MRFMKLLIVSACIITLSVTTPFAEGTIKVGALLAVTGPASFLGAPEAKTLEMLVSQINAKGGIDGNKVELVIKDTGASPEKAISFAKQLIEEEKVFAIIGPRQVVKAWLLRTSQKREKQSYFPAPLRSKSWYPCPSMCSRHLRWIVTP